MASKGPQSAATFLLFLNLIMYVAVAVIAGWVINYSIDKTPSSCKYIFQGNLNPPNLIN